MIDRWSTWRERRRRRQGIKLVRQAFDRLRLVHGDLDDEELWLALRSGLGLGRAVVVMGRTVTNVGRALGKLPEPLIRDLRDIDFQRGLLRETCEELEADFEDEWARVQARVEEGERIVSAVAAVREDLYTEREGLGERRT